MRLSELNRAVAQATGESISTIRQLGFSLVAEGPEEIADDISFGPNMIDWDELEISRAQLHSGSEQDVPSAA